MIAQVVFNLPLERAFDYLVPAAFEPQIRPGLRVLAPFGRRRLIGLVIGLPAASAIAHPKPLLRLIDPQPVLTEEALALARWMAVCSYCSLGEACTGMVPATLRVRAEVTGASATRMASDPSTRAPALAVGPSPGPTLTAHQQRAWLPMAKALQASRHEVFLLQGVTGSGKTELYFQAIAAALQQGRSAIALVPEIAITPQTIDRFTQRFGSQVALWHSRLTRRQRAETWRRLSDGSARIVVGTRSAVFAPVRRLGVIAVDEEHDPSYKQQDTPRYHAREVAIVRARAAGAIVILGSATPSVDSAYRAQQRHATRLVLPERIHGRPLPTVELIDMRQEVARRHRLAPLSVRLQLALARVIEQGEQAILLLNRRGFARTIICLRCGQTLCCPRCAVPLIYHAGANRLECHYCSVRQAAPDACPSCHRDYLRFRGTGTERVESELHRLFPAFRIGRMDRDTTSARDSHRVLYEALKTQHVAVMVGTQMIAKGFDLPQVTLVGVVSADTALNLPDFRAGERTFSLLTQVAGRAGRGDRPGHVLVQTYAPDHYAIQAASRHDYQTFYEAEIRMRRRLRLPPVVSLVELTVQGRSAERVQAAATALAAALGANAKRLKRRRVTLQGPAPHRIARLRGTTRWRIVLKAASLEPIHRLLRRTLSEGRRFHGLPVIVDVDPL